MTVALILAALLVGVAVGVVVMLRRIDAVIAAMDDTQLAELAARVRARKGVDDTGR